MQAASQPISKSTAPNTLQGLSESEASARRAKGQGNNVRLETGRSYGQIIRANVLTFINAVLFGIGVVLVLLGLYTDAFLSVGIALMNVVVGLVQELRAKRTLDKIALLTRPKATVVRDGAEKTVDPTEIVVGDVLVVHAGDQIVVDGKIIHAGKMEVDESLLTGESDLIAKHNGDPVYSGSFCVNGSGHYEAEKVGLESVANKLTAGARAFRQVKTPLQTDIDFVVRLLLALATAMALVFGVSAIISQLPLTETARIASVVTGLIPNGLFFMISVAYAMGAVRMANQGALIQQSNAVESMSNINILCLDKTGTLTANHIHLKETAPLGISDEELRRMLGIYAASTEASNRTSEALHEALKGEQLTPKEEVPFSSSQKWSAIAFDNPALKGVYVMGAPEILRPHLQAGAKADGKIQAWSDQGLRVLLFAYRPEVTPLYDGDKLRELPGNLIPMGLMSFSDELRPEAEVTLKGFAEAGIGLKIISGDNPNTVAALAKQAGLQGDIQVISGDELKDMNDAQLAEAAETHTIFGRITPQQKEKLVDVLHGAGHYVAMIGDGVNDVLSLKKAQIGIAMQSGSQATRGAADIILLNDSFAALPSAFQEGQRIINGMQDIMRLFLSRVVYQTLIIIAVAIIGAGFPITPVHQSLLSLFTVGIPTLFLAAWARPGAPKSRLIEGVIRFILPAGVTLAAIGTGLYLLSYVSIFTASAGTPTIRLDRLSQAEVTTLQSAHNGMSLSDIAGAAQNDALNIARTILTTVTTIGGLLLIVFVEPPTRFWALEGEGIGDWRPTIMTVVLLIIYVVIMSVPGLRDFFELAPITVQDWLLIGVVLAGWVFVVRFIWRSRLFDRFLRLG